MTYYTIIGRADGDDEASCLVTQAANADAAVKQFKDWINELNDGQVPEDETSITYVFKSESKPEIVASPGGF